MQIVRHCCSGWSAGEILPVQQGVALGNMCRYQHQHTLRSLFWDKIAVAKTDQSVWDWTPQTHDALRQARIHLCDCVMGLLCCTLCSLCAAAAAHSAHTCPLGIVRQHHKSTRLLCK